MRAHNFAARTLGGVAKEPRGGRASRGAADAGGRVDRAAAPVFTGGTRETAYNKAVGGAALVERAVAEEPGGGGVAVGGAAGTVLRIGLLTVCI